MKIKNKAKGITESIVNTINLREEINDPNAKCLEMKRFIQLDRYSCAIQTAYNVLDYYGLIEDESELDKYAKYEGLGWPPLKRILNGYGIRITQKYGADEYDIKKAIDKGFPIITTINNGMHWIVIYGYSTTKGSISHYYVSDPSVISSFSVKWALDKFKNKWKEYDENWIAICKG